ncbi:MAG: ABC transporter substrate-binding protein [Nannocystaceae bacterium]
MRESTNKLKTPVWAPAALFALACSAGACSAVLDFTECRTDEDCSTFFVDNRPLFCNEAENRCKVKNPGCDSTADCANHSENSICGLSNECFELLSGDETPCDEPQYPGGSDEFVYIGSIVDRGATYASGVEHAIELALSDFNESSTIDGKKVAWIRCDSAGSADQAAAAAEYLAGRADEGDGDIVGVGVAGVIGPFDDSDFKRVAEVSLSGGVNAFTISPAAVGAITTPDPTGVVWRGNAGAERQGEAILARINDLAPNSIMVLYGNEAAGDYAQSMYEAMASSMKLNLPDGIGGAQTHLLYNSALAPADLVALLNPLWQRRYIWRMLPGGLKH